MSSRSFNILMLCSGNSARSIHSEALLNHLGKLLAFLILWLMSGLTASIARAAPAERVEALPNRHVWLWLGIYNLIYVTPLLIITIAFTFTLGSRKLSENEGRILKLLSGLMMLALGTLLVFFPAALNDLRIALGLLAASVLATLQLHRVHSARQAPPDKTRI